MPASLLHSFDTNQQLDTKNNFGHATQTVKIRTLNVTHFPAPTRTFLFSPKSTYVCLASDHTTAIVALSIAQARPLSATDNVTISMPSLSSNSHYSHV